MFYLAYCYLQTSKILIFKNDRTGDLFTSLNTINLIFNKHKEDDIEIYLSKVNQKFKRLKKLKNYGKLEIIKSTKKNRFKEIKHK